MDIQYAPTGGKSTFKKPKAKKTKPKKPSRATRVFFLLDQSKLAHSIVISYISIDLESSSKFAES